MTALVDFDFPQHNDLLRRGAAAEPSGARIRELRTQLGEDLCQVVLQAARLQPKAREKFGDGIWWCTERALQQATPRPVAELKASFCGGADQLDLCSGIGGDAIAMALRLRKDDELTVVDRDPLMIAMARANLDQTAPRGAVWS
ncbi:MAG: class I SAM-dependent methyltransferase, partial [Planctomycetota bacterium]